MNHVAPINKLVDQFRRLPGIGPKSATRLAYFILKADRERAEALAQAILNAKEQVGFCSQCFNFTDTDPCQICQSEARDHSLICVVEEPSDVAALERTREFKGLYHVLHGALSPLAGIGPDDLKLKELLKRVGKGGVAEVVMATNPNVEGEATAMYIARLLKPLGVKVTKIARGLPVGGDLEYADEVTLSEAFENRREM
ncbi:MAG: recombination mediator RecR [Negativicutes bacterium]|nr:recombination mediator RecR [Negativicutes bacterium]